MCCYFNKFEMLRKTYEWPFSRMPSKMCFEMRAFAVYFTTSRHMTIMDSSHFCWDICDTYEVLKFKFWLHNRPECRSCFSDFYRQ